MKKLLKSIFIITLIASLFACSNLINNGDKPDDNGENTSTTDLSLGFGTPSNFSKIWDLSGTKDTKPKLEAGQGRTGDSSEYGVVFDFKKLGTGTASLSRKISVAEPSLISFYYRSDISEEYDGRIEFYIDNNLAGTYTGNGYTFGEEHVLPYLEWRQDEINIASGSHTLLWKAVGTFEYGYSEGTTNSICFDDLSIRAVTVPELLSEDFEGSTLNDVVFGAGYVSCIAEDDEFKNCVQYGDALVDKHSKVFKIATIDMDESTWHGTSSLKLLRVNPSVESAVSFDFKMAMIEDDYFEVTVDGVPQTIYVDGKDEGTKLTAYNSPWKKGSVIISAGEHTVELKVKNTNYSYGCYIINGVYLDNISLCPNVVEKVSLYPMGLQETYTGGFDINFTAKPLRKDGSIINGKTVSWTGAQDGVFHPDAEGDFTVTATVDGKSASNTTVKVHSSNYLQDPVTLNGITFTGAVSNGTGTRNAGKQVTFEAPTPEYTSFDADGFFVVKGRADNVTLQFYIVKLENGNDTKYYTNYIVRPGNFEERIWLRFGAGEYRINIFEMYDATYTTPNGDYLGTVTNYGENYSYVDSLFVTNTNDSIAESDAVYLLPSSWCQLDNFKITNTVHGIVGALPADASVGQKLAALHDWEIDHMYYDEDSVDGPRKVQDAMHVLEYGMGVCEGYANLFTAFERVIGVKGTVICAEYNNHAWNNTFYKNEWRLVDPTWDDTDFGNIYTYFLVTAEQDKLTDQDHGYVAVSAEHPLINKWDGEDISRTVVGTGIKRFQQFDMPDGWY